MRNYFAEDLPRRKKDQEINSDSFGRDIDNISYLWHVVMDAKKVRIGIEKIVRQGKKTAKERSGYVSR